jgi:hypothetical protein
LGAGNLANGLSITNLIAAGIPDNVDGLRANAVWLWRDYLRPLVAKTAFLAFCFLGTSALPYMPTAAQAQSAQNLAPINLAQSTPVIPSLYPTDITPTPIGRERELLRPGPTYYFYQKLPSRLWFNLSGETSQRYESNVFLTRNHGRSDYVYRVLPNVTVGYNLFGRTSIYTNYFVLKDLFAGRGLLSFPTTQSLSLGLRHEIPLNGRTTLQFDFQSRELWQSSHLHQADLIPGVTLTRTLTARSVFFTNALLQMRGRNYFVAPTRELDPFFTLGFLHSRGAWVFSAVGTLVFNVRHPPFGFSIPNVGNDSIIADFEVSHPVSSRLPGLVAFLRAEPIWNWASRGVPGISGYDFRLFGGLRYTLVKPAYHTSIRKLKQQLKESETDDNSQNTHGSSNKAQPKPAEPNSTEPKSVAPAPQGDQSGSAPLHGPLNQAQSVPPAQL